MRNHANVAMGAEGQLVYHEARRGPGFRLFWVDVEGDETPAWPETLSDWWGSARISPDGRRVSVSSVDAGGLLRMEILDFERRTRAELFPQEQVGLGVWSPDGELVAVSVRRQGRNALVLTAPRPGEPTQTLAAEPGMYQLFPGSFTPDGRTILYTRTSMTAIVGDILLVAVDGATPPEPFLAGPHDESWPRLSPDGRWVLYGSDAGGEAAVWIADFPDGKGRWQVTGGAGWLDAEQIWWRDGDGRIQAARIVPRGHDLDLSDRRQLLGGRTLDADTEGLLDYSPTRRQFLLARAAAPFRESDLVVVSDWRALLADREKP
jgi:Tol biopolymer transport system component